MLTSGLAGTDGAGVAAREPLGGPNHPERGPLRDRKFITAKSLRRLEARRLREGRRVVDGEALKRERVWSGRGCEVCGWRAGDDWRVLHAHHLVPLSCGGSDQAGNQVVLCPNHHALAHRVGRRRNGVWEGPRTRPELFLALVRLERAWETAASA